MALSPPASLHALLSATDHAAEERAWAAFLEEFSGLLLRVARALGGDEDAVMDRYAFVLDALRRDGYRRLRGYVADGRAHFATWLAIVARRLCLDEYRQRCGRPQGPDASVAVQWVERRNLARLVVVELEDANVAAPGDEAPDAAVERAELLAALAKALDALSVEDRLMLRFIFVDGLSVPQAARALGAASAFQLYRRRDRVLHRLRTALMAMGVNEPRP